MRLAAAATLPTRISTKTSVSASSPIDSVHSPVRNYTVARLGQITDYDVSTLEVWTNGSITPADSIGLSGEALALLVISP